MHFFPDLSFQRILFQACAALIIITTHGFFLAAFARLFGDRGPQYDGRLSLNPFKHIEPIGALALVFVQIGWIRPLALETKLPRGGKSGPFLVAALSVLATLTLSLVFWNIRPLAFAQLGGGSVGISAIGILETTARSSVYFALFNLIPLLPLSLGHALIGFAPRLAGQLVRHQSLVALGLGAAVFATGPYLRALIGPLVGTIF